MTIKTIFGAIFCGFSLAACGHAADTPVSHIPAVIETSAQNTNEWEAFILPRYKVLSRASGNLNNDGFEDMALVLAQENEAKPAVDETGVFEHGEPLRPLLLLLRQEDGSLKLAQRNDHAIMCFYCGGPMGEAFEGIDINPGKVSIYHSGGSAWRWASETTLAYDAFLKDWLLRSAETTIFNAMEEGDVPKLIKETKTSEDFGTVSFSDFNIYEVAE